MAVLAEKRIFSIRLPNVLIAQLDQLAAEHGWSRTDEIVQALKKHVEAGEREDDAKTKTRR